MPVTAELRYELDRDWFVVRLRGQMTRADKVAVRSALAKCLADCPQAVLVQLDEFVDLTDEAPAMFLALHRKAARDHPTRLVWYQPAGALAARLALPFWRQKLRIAFSHEQAQVAALAPQRYAHAHLPPGRDAVRAAGSLAAAACRDWDLPNLARPAAAVLVELAGQLRPDADARLDAVVSRRGWLVHLRAVDHDQREPAATDPPGDRATRACRRYAAAFGRSASGDGHRAWAVLDTRNAGRHRRPAARTNLVTSEWLMQVAEFYSSLADAHRGRIPDDADAASRDRAVAAHLDELAWREYRSAGDPPR